MSQPEKCVPVVDKPVDLACQDKMQNENFAALSKGIWPTQIITSIYFHINTKNKKTKLLSEAICSACSPI